MLNFVRFFRSNKVIGSKRRLLTMNHERVIVSLTPSAQETIEFGDYDINDGNWYYVTVTWRKDTGFLEVRVNAVLVAVRQNYARGDSLMP